MKYSCLAFLVLLINQSIAQDFRFIVRVSHFTPPDTNGANDRCSGTVVSARHVLAPASCVTPVQAHRRIIVRKFVGNSISIFTPTRISIHPSYRTNRIDHANIALIFVNRHFTSPNFPPRAVSDLPSNVTCNLYGWDQQTAAPRHEDVFIYRAEFCDPSSPQVSCSTFQSLEDEICSARLGSPVFCEANYRFSGFMTSDGCISDGTRVRVNYQSTNTFRLWFDEVLRADSSDRHESSQFIVNVMEFNPRVGASERFRCVGTLITQSHVLTTASCVQATSNFQFVIGVQANWENIGRNVVEPEAIFIHPNFEAAQIFTANVAVIRNGLRIMHQNLVIPRTLGSLPTNNATDGHLCQIVGWGNTIESSRQDVVAVYRPQLCQSNLPQVFCSIINTELSETQTAIQGSPVICGDGSAVAGFVLGSRVTNLLGNLNALDFHSVGDFREWIENVSGADKLAKLSVLAILSAMFISVKNFL